MLSGTEKSKKLMIRKLITILVFVTLLGVIAFVVKKEIKDIPLETPPDSLQQTEITVRGRIICLLHKDTSGPQTTECALGFEDERGNKYGLSDSDSGYKNLSGVSQGKLVTLEGSFRPQKDSKYDSLGVIEVIRIVDSRPVKFETDYIGTADWPPQINLINKSFECVEAGSESGRAGKSERRVINGKEYCVTEVKEGAAGSMYTQYAYAREEDGKTLVLTFSLRMPQCGNYQDPEKSWCELEVDIFNPDEVVDRILDSGIWRIAAELKECLPKSDMASKDKCDELMKKIKDFEMCVGAGFSIQESQPRRCQLANGTQFTEE
jgi:hypothetical protein